MIALGKETLHQYRQFVEWTDSLRELEDHVWLRPIAEGKASAAEIVSHLRNWDDYLLTTVIPAVHNGEGITFPDFDSFNRQAYAYAQSGVAQDRLLDEFRQTRIQLVDRLLADPELAARHAPANGAETCPYTGTPYSLLYIVYEFIEHDNHHKKQIITALNL